MDGVSVPLEDGHRISRRRPARSRSPRSRGSRGTACGRDPRQPAASGQAAAYASRSTTGTCGAQRRPAGRGDARRGPSPPPSAPAGCAGRCSPAARGTPRGEQVGVADQPNAQARSALRDDRGPRRLFVSAMSTPAGQGGCRSRSRSTSPRCDPDSGRNRGYGRDGSAEPAARRTWVRGTHRSRARPGRPSGRPCTRCRHRC